MGTYFISVFVFYNESGSSYLRFFRAQKGGDIITSISFPDAGFSSLQTAIVDATAFIQSDRVQWLEDIGLRLVLYETMDVSHEDDLQSVHEQEV